MSKKTKTDTQKGLKQDKELDKAARDIADIIKKTRKSILKNPLISDALYGDDSKLSELEKDSIKDLRDFMGIEQRE